MNRQDNHHLSALESANRQQARASLLRCASLIAGCALLIAGCATTDSEITGSEPEPDHLPQLIDESALSFCDADMHGLRVLTNEDNEEVGYLCVIRPSDVEAGQFDLDPEGSGNGFGYHVVAIPKTITADTRGAILFSGSYGSPYNQNDLVRLELPAGTIRYAPLLQDGVEEGFIVVQPAYSNAGSINGTLCGLETEHPAHLQNDNCHDLARTWALQGEQRCLANEGNCDKIAEFTFGDAQTDHINSFDNRLRTLVDYLAPKLALPQALIDLDYGQLNVMGHSQGSGYVYLIGKYISDIRRGCLLSGPRDFNKLEQRYADWFTTMDDNMLAPKDRFRGIVSNRDAVTAISNAYEHLGLNNTEHYTVVEDPTGANGHETVFLSPEHSAVRKSHCFD